MDQVDYVLTGVKVDCKRVENLKIEFKGKPLGEENLQELFESKIDDLLATTAFKESCSLEKCALWTQNERHKFVQVYPLTIGELFTKDHSGQLVQLHP